MPIIIYPNIPAQPTGAVPAKVAPPLPSALVRRGSGFSKSFKASLRNKSSSSLDSNTSGHSPKATFADTYHLTRRSSPLNTTLLPSQSRSPVYCVTTDVHQDGACATTHLWHFDRDRRDLRDVAWVRWSASSPPLVGVAGVQMPVTEFLTKSKGMGFSSRNHSYTFTSEIDTYKWIPHSGIFDSKPASWRCMAAATGVPASKQALLAVYRPPTANTHAASPSGDYSPPLAHALISATHLTSTPAAHGPYAQQATATATSQAALEIHDAVQNRSALRDIVVLTFVLVVAGRDEWRALAAGGPAQTSELVFSRMMQETYHPTWSCTTLPDTSI